MSVNNTVARISSLTGTGRVPVRNSSISAAISAVCTPRYLSAPGNVARRGVRDVIDEELRRTSRLEIMFSDQHEGRGLYEREGSPQVDLSPSLYHGYRCRSTCTLLFQPRQHPPERGVRQTARRKPLVPPRVVDIAPIRSCEQREPLRLNQVEP